MGLYLVGENLDANRGYRRAETGELIQLMRGIYVDAGDDADDLVLRHAVRIARYLYPRAFLSAASAVLLAPTRDGRLYISGQRSQRTRLRGLEIVQNRAPARPSTIDAVVADGWGELPVPVSSLRQRFLEAFRLRSEHAQSMDLAMREALAARLVQEYGDAQRAADALWTLARDNEWYREGEGAERFLKQQSDGPMRNEAAFDLTVAWHGLALGDLAHDGTEWRWNASSAGPVLPPLIRQTTPGRLPPFIVSLLPEGWLESVLHDASDRDVLRRGKRYMSNITISERRAELAALPQDRLTTRLADFTRDGMFSGHYAGPRRDAMDADFAHRLAQLFANQQTPRLSGVQVKAPMHLAADGTLLIATHLPFTHILKPAGAAGFEGLPVAEWIGLTLARGVGFEVPDHALVAMPDDLPAALIVERFDIRLQLDDTRLLAMEDLCSVLALDPRDKYTGTMERVARAVRALSTSPDEDIMTLLRRALFAWLIGDGDMHLKNMAMLKTAQEGAATFRHVRLAPVYDTLTTRVFPGLQHDAMALKVNGKAQRLRRADFLALAAIADLRAGDAKAAIDEMLASMTAALDQFALPPSLQADAAALALSERVLQVTRERVRDFD